MPAMNQPPILARENLAKQVDRPSAGGALVQTETVAKFVQERYDGEAANQDDPMQAGYVMAASTASAVDSRDNEFGLCNAAGLG